MYKPQGATIPLHYHGRIDGVWEITWDMGNGQRKMTLQIGGEMPAGPTLLQQMWKMLDEEVKKVKAEGDGIETQLFEAKCRARMMCEVLALWMPPHFHTPDEIAKESLRRYYGDETYETPGLGSLRYTPPPSSKRYDTPPPKPKSRFDDATLGTIKDLYEKGVPAEKLARLFEATVDEVKAVL